MQRDNKPASTPSSPARRKVSLGAAALIVGSMLPLSAFAADFPTDKVNTTGLAVTDDVVKVGILHSVTGTMSISETGSVQAEKLAISQINARPEDRVHSGRRRQRLADLCRKSQEAAGQ